MRFGMLTNRSGAWHHIVDTTPDRLITQALDELSISENVPRLLTQVDLEAMQRFQESYDIEMRGLQEEDDIIALIGGLSSSDANLVHAFVHQIDLKDQE